MSTATRTALDAFVEHHARAEAAIERLTGTLEDHYGVDPDRIDWGHAGTAEHIAGLLEAAVDAAEDRAMRR